MRYKVFLRGFLSSAACLLLGLAQAWAALPHAAQYPGATRSQSFDGFYRPVGIDVKNSAGQTLLQISNSFNQESSITRQHIQQAGGISGTIDYQYDALDRLISASPSQSLLDWGLNQEHYSYDAAHNRLSSAHQPGHWQYASGNRLAQWGHQQNQTSYTHTASGQIETATRGIGAGASTWRYHYDASQNLSQITTESGQTIARYQYDPAGRRISKTTGQGASQQTTWYIYAGEGLLAEIDARGQTTTSYGWQADTPWGTAPLWQADHANPATPQYHYLHGDHLERPLVASNASGQATWQALPESFGQTWVNPASSARINLRLPGQYWDQESGAHYNQQRHYQPQTGRYLQSDPWGLYDGVNTYAYAYQNPLGYTDPTGEVVPALAWGYARCIGQCKLTDALLAAYEGECDPRTLGDCALECLNPLNWIGGGKAKVLRKPPPPVLMPQIQDVKKHGIVSKIEKRHSDIERHHSDPVFMGGEIKQPLTKMKEETHHKLHNEMNVFLQNKTNGKGDHMRPLSNNPGDKIRDVFSREERLDALAEFYKGPGAKYKKAASDFFKQHPEKK